MRLLATRGATDRDAASVATPTEESPAGESPSAGSGAAGVAEDAGRERDATGDGAPPDAAEPGEAGARPGAREGGDAGAAPAAGAVAAPTIDRAALEGMSDRVLEAISRYYGRDVARERGEISCPELQAAFVEVMDSWIDYSTRGKQAWQGRLPEDLAERDERLYRGVQDVERLFGGSGCPRP
jgi:hypothetical protein